MKKPLTIIIISLLILAIILFVSLLLIIFKKDGKGILKIDEEESLQSCGDKQVLFTHSPVNLDEIISITPLGNLNPPGHTFPVKHMYINLKDITSSTDADEPNPIRTLYAPGDILIRRISSVEYLNKEESDFSINFSSCEEFFGYFHHIPSISDKLEQAFNQAEGECSEENIAGNRMKNCDKRLNIKLEAGEEIGTVGGRSFNFDIGTTDLRVEPSEAARYDVRFEDIGYVVCPLDYFSDDIKEALYSKLGDSNGIDKRTIEPICGTPHQDLSGTAQGVWYLQNSSNLDKEVDHIALVHDNIDPRIPVFSIGTSLEEFGIESNTYRFEPSNTGLVDRDFDDVKADGDIYCYDFNEGGGEDSFPVLLKLDSDKILKIGKGQGRSCGNGPWLFGEYATYEKLN